MFSLSNFCFKIIFLISFLFSLTVQERLINITGSNSFQIGKQIGISMKTMINTIYDQKVSQYPGDITFWEGIAENSEEMIKKHCPVSYQELKGMSSVDGLTMKKLLMLNTEYEVLMYKFAAKKCSGFAFFNETKSVCGQTNDEPVGDWFDGVHDRVLKINEDTFIYTPYMGMNSHGLVVLWQYVDSGERNWNSFVPTTVVLRELLTKTSVLEAVDFLEKIPHAVPNNFLIVKGDEGYANVELSPFSFTSIFSPNGKISSLCHTNHFVFSQYLMDNEKSASPTSVPRYQKCRELIKDFSENGIFDENKAIEMLETVPIKRNITLASMVFLSNEKKMMIKFIHETIWLTFKLQGSDNMNVIIAIVVPVIIVGFIFVLTAFIILMAFCCVKMMAKGEKGSSGGKLIVEEN